MPEKIYYTLMNGKPVYRVFDNPDKKVLRIVTPERVLSENEMRNIPSNERNIWAIYYKLSEFSIPYTRVWFAHAPGFSNPKSASPFYRKHLDGYEILVEISCYEGICSYVLIGTSIIFFWTPQPIELYYSIDYSNTKPHGLAATRDYVYAFSHYNTNDRDETISYFIVAVSRKSIEKKLRKETGKILTDKLTQEDLSVVDAETFDLPQAPVKQDILHEYSTNEYKPFNQALFKQIMNRVTLEQRRENYANTTISLGSRVPMNIAHHIAEMKTGLAYRPYKKNTIRQKRINNANVLGPFPENFHNGADNNLLVTPTSCKKGNCAIMGGYKRRTLKHRVHYKK